MNKLQALIFDVDGTLANTERDGHRVGFNKAFAEMGLDWHWSVDLYSELLAVAGGKERIRYFIERDRPTLPKVENLDEFIKQLHQLKNKHYQALLKQGAIPLRPGVKRLISEAREQGLRLAIATTTT
ncbi:MAG: HAD family hydrolase, partial [Cyanobacteria bacterium J06642_3]